MDVCVALFVRLTKPEPTHTREDTTFARQLPVGPM